MQPGVPAQGCDVGVVKTQPNVVMAADVVDPGAVGELHDRGLHACAGEGAFDVGMQPGDTRIRHVDGAEKPGGRFGVQLDQRRCIDLRQATLDSLTEAIGVVTQDAHMFHDTIRNNLLYARPDATDAELGALPQALSARRAPRPNDPRTKTVTSNK